MKYLKKFNENSSSSTYSEIPSIVADAVSFIDMSLKTFNEINSFISDELIVSRSSYPINENKSIIGMTITKRLSTAYIVVGEDEWFYVTSNFKSRFYQDYKCDQIQGLIDCLKSLGIIE